MKFAKFGFSVNFLELKNINLGAHYLLLTLFTTSIFKVLYGHFLAEFTLVYLRPFFLAFSLKEDPVRCVQVCDESWVILIYQFDSQVPEKKFDWQLSGSHQAVVRQLSGIHVSFNSKVFLLQY